MNFQEVGGELPEVDFGEIIRSVAQGIADGQRALDLSSINTLQILANTPISIIPEVTETITPAPFQVNVSGQAPVTVTGARITTTPSDPVSMNALQAGLVPTFYQFTEAVINLKVSVQLRETTETDTDGSARTGVTAFASHVNFRAKNTYSYSLNAATTVNVTMRPVPPTVRLQPSVITVNALGKQTTVSVSSLRASGTRPVWIS